MPDGDVFARSVSRPWSGTSRRVFAGGEAVTVVPMAVKVLLCELRQVAPGVLDRLISIIKHSQNLPIDDRWMFVELTLRDIQRDDISDFMGVLVQSAEHAVLLNSDEHFLPLEQSRDALVEFLASAIDGCIYNSSALARGVTHLQVSGAMIQNRRNALGVALRESEDLRNVAMQLEQANGQGQPTIRAPRRKRRPQVEIIGYALY